MTKKQNFKADAGLKVGKISTNMVAVPSFLSSPLASVILAND